MNLPNFRRLPSRRALAAFAKLHGYRLERRWPFLIRAQGAALNLNFQDLLEFQYARSRRFMVLTIGAYDGVANDPVAQFVRERACAGVLVEPQPAVYARLCENYRGLPQFSLVNAAIDESSGTREIFYIPGGDASLPEWTQQLASFDLAHLLKHEAQAPGLSAQVRSQVIPTLSFGALLDRHGISNIDVLQIDAEGMDGKMLKWFPFDRLRPAVLHYETAHLDAGEHAEVRARLRGYGYWVREADSPTDDMAVLV